MNLNLGGFKTILFDNKTIKQTIFKNTVWLTIGTVISRLFKLVLIIYVARILGATEYGKFTFALAFGSLFIVLANLGLPYIVMREFAQGKEREKEFYSILSLKLCLSIGALILIFIGSFFITPDMAIRKLIWILALYILVDSFYSLINCFFDANQRMEYEAFGVILSAVTTTIVGLFVIFNFPSVMNLSYAYLFGSTTVLIFSIIILYKKFLPIKLCWQKEIWKKFLSMSWPLAVASFFGSILTNTDSSMLGYFGQITQTGWYNAAYRIINISLLPMGLVAGSFFPAFSKLASPVKDMVPEEIQERKNKLQDIWDSDLNIMILIAIPLMAGGIILAPQIIGFLYGTNFLPSVLAFQILIVMAGIAFLYTPFYDILIAFGQQKRIFWASLSGAVINFFLNLFLIPQFSLYGAAAATVITHLLVFFIFYKFVFKYTSIGPLQLKFVLVVLGATFSSFMMFLGVSFLKVYNIHIFLLILFGVIIYGAFILFFKKIADILEIKIF